MATQSPPPTFLFSSPLTIDKLDGVYKLLIRSGFPQTRWHELGLLLGLHINTLNTIKKEHSSDAYYCFTECLSKWLSRADSVDSKGGATFDSLSDALKSMNENAAADKLDQEKRNIALAVEIFNTHHPLLSQSLSDPVSVAIMLQREGVITGQVLASVESASPSVPNQLEVLLAAIREVIQSKYSLLQTFASVLCKFTGNIGAVIQRDYDRYLNDDKKLIKVMIPDDDGMSTDASSTESTPPCVPTVEIAIPQCMSDEFTSIQTSYGQMLYNIRKIIKKEPPPLDDVREYLCCCRSSLEPKLSLCSNTTEILRVVEKECSLINVRLLQSLVEEFDIKEAEKLITEYKGILKEFCHTVKISLCLNEKFEALGGSPSLQCETVTYVFDWEPDEHMLQDIKRIISKTSGKLVKIKYIKKGNSIIVTCSFPHSLTGALIIKLSENLELLIKNGLMKLTVGYCTIWKKQKEQLQLEEVQEATQNERVTEATPLSVTNGGILLDDTSVTIMNTKLIRETEANKQLQKMLKKIRYNKHQPNQSSLTNTSSVSYKIRRGMRMEIEQILTNKTGLLDQNESLIDIKREIAELQEQISVMGVHILNKREENEDLIKEWRKHVALPTKTETDESEIEEILLTGGGTAPKKASSQSTGASFLVEKFTTGSDPSSPDAVAFCKVKDNEIAAQKDITQLSQSYLFSSPLTIDQLDDVISLLVKCGFPQNRWRQLGHKLGLDRKILDSIAENYSEEKDCFNECIAIWLHRGGATFDSLSKALRSLFENAVADKLNQERKPLSKYRPISTESTRVSRDVKELVRPHTTGLDRHKFKNRQEPGGGNVKALKGHFESEPLKEVTVENASSAKPLEYMALKETSADLVDLLAGNPAQKNITQFSQSALFSSPLTIDQLDDVISLLVKCGFPIQKKWRNLGLKLGLDRKTLADIAANYSEGKDCFNECIAIWLHRGGATFDSLSKALRLLFENAAADKLDQERKPLSKVRPKSTESSRISRVVEGIEHHPTSGPDSDKSKNRQEPGTGKINTLRGHFESGKSKEVKVQSKDASSAKPLEYMTLKETSAGLVDLLAGNPVLITQLTNLLFASYTIPQEVQRDVTNTQSSPLSPGQRAGKLMDSLLDIIEKHPDPLSVISSLITSLQKVKLISIADRLEMELNLRGRNPVTRVRRLSKRFEKGKLEEVKDEEEGTCTLAKSPECISMASADLVDLIAGNAPVISPLNDDLLSLHIIPKSVFFDVADTSCSPAERAEKLVIPLLEIIEKHPDPSTAISSLITSLRKVDLNFIADKLRKESINKKELLTIQGKTVVIELSTKDEVIQGLEDLNFLFSGIIEKLKNQFRNLITSNKLKLQDVALHIEKNLEANLKKGSLDDIFTSILPYCDPLNYTLIQSLVQNLIPEGNELQNDLCQYINGIEKLSRSSQMKHFRSAASPALPLLCRTNEQIVIKFHKRWEMMTISSFNDTLQHYFKECHADCYKTFNSLTALSIMLSIVKSQAENFIKVVEDRRESLERIGILEVAIGQRKLIYVEREENNNFNISLRQSVKAGDSFEVSMLLQLGADPNSKDEGEKSAVEIAIEGEAVHVIKALLDGGGSFFSVLISAVKKNEERVVKMLVDAGIDVNLQGRGKETALIVAAQCNQEGIVHFLLQQKAILVDKADNLGYTALHYACREESEDIVKYLLKKNANIHLHTKNNSTPLTLATQHNHEHIVELLLPESTKDEIVEAIEVARTHRLQWLLVTQKENCNQDTISDCKYVRSPTRSTTVTVRGNDIEIVGLSNFEACQAAVDKWKDSQNIVIKDSSCESVSFIVSHVLENQKVKALKIDGCTTPLTRHSVNSFSTQLKSNESLWRLTVTNDSITDDGLEALVESIESNRHLTFLSLYGNPSIRSAKSLAKLIETNTSLTYLSVWGTKIGQDGGALLLLEALKKNKHLITLVLDDKNAGTCRFSPLYQDVEHRLKFLNTQLK